MEATCSIVLEHTAVFNVAERGGGVGGGGASSSGLELFSKALAVTHRDAAISSNGVQ